MVRNDDPLGPPHRLAIRAVLFAVGAGSPARILLLALDTGAVVRTLNLPGFLNRIALHPSRPILAATTGPGGVLLWNTDTGAPLPTLIGHTNDGFALAFSADGRHLAANGSYYEDHLTIWNVP